MKNLIYILLCLSFTLHAKTTPEPTPAELRYPIEFLFQKVLEAKGQTFRAEVPFPSIHFESKTPLSDFQDAVEEQWGMRPEHFTNAFAFKVNKIFMLDDADYYLRTKRCMDDSLVHELVHYIQVKYQGWEENDDSLEWEAVDIQTQFRDKYCPVQTLDTPGK